MERWRSGVMNTFRNRGVDEGENKGLMYGGVKGWRVREIKN